MSYANRQPDTSSETVVAQLEADRVRRAAVHRSPEYRMALGIAEVALQLERILRPTSPVVTEVEDEPYFKNLRTPELPTIAERVNLEDQTYPEDTILDPTVLLTNAEKRFLPLAGALIKAAADAASLEMEPYA